MPRTACPDHGVKRGHNYVTVFIDLDRTQKPVVFVTPVKGKRCIARFRDFLVSHGGEADGIVEVVCDMSPAFLAAIGETFEQANVYGRLVPCRPAVHQGGR